MVLYGDFKFLLIPPISLLNAGWGRTWLKYMGCGGIDLVELGQKSGRWPRSKRQNLVLPGVGAGVLLVLMGAQACGLSPS